jgi:hypothetical protein
MNTLFTKVVTLIIRLPQPFNQTANLIVEELYGTPESPLEILAYHVVPTI